MSGFKFTDEETEWLKTYIPGHRHHEAAEEFSKRFRPITKAQVRAFANRRKVKTGFVGRENGHPVTCTKPVGTETKVRGDYTWVKTESGKWVRKHRAVYEQYHGKVPPGHVVIFLDGDKNNCSPDNLAAVTLGQRTALRNLQLDNCGKYINEALMIVEIQKAIKERRRKK